MNQMSMTSGLLKLPGLIAVDMQTATLNASSAVHRVILTLRRHRHLRLSQGKAVVMVSKATMLWTTRLTKMTTRTT